VGSLAGLVGIWIFQPDIAASLGAGDALASAATAVRVLCSSTALSTGSELLDPLVSTGGIEGMLPTIYLVVSAMLFGGVMIATGMLGSITRAITSRLSRARSLVGVTVGSGLFLNSCTGDQYLSIIIGGNIYKNTYRRCGMKPQLLSRTLEDSISVTSVLIPWNSCGVTQSTVLGVATLVYFPFCLFNILSPVMTMVMAWTGWRLLAAPRVLPAAHDNVQ
jgi:NhaC family Na+:H+ antiporter